MKIDYHKIIDKHLGNNPVAYRIYLMHVTLVTNRALTIARYLGLPEDQQRFIEEAAMLHDIGIYKTQMPTIGCVGLDPYLMHTVLGHEILSNEGLPDHAEVALRHTGTGITAEEVRDCNLALPEMDYRPTTLTQRIISYADIFYTKDPERILLPLSDKEVEEMQHRFYQPEQKIEIFRSWQKEFGEA